MFRAVVRILSAAFVWFIGTLFIVVMGREIGRLNGERIPPLSASGPPWVAFLGAVWGGAFFVHAVRYVTSGKSQRFWTSPEFLFLVDEVGVVNRFDFLRRVWLYTWLRWSAKAGMYLGPVITLSHLSGPSALVPAPQVDSFRFTAEYGYAGLLLVSLAVTFVVSSALRQAIAVALPTVHAAVAVQQCLAAGSQDRRSKGTKRRAELIDLLGQRRVLLARAARVLNTAATRIDLAFGQHPVASILRASSRRIHAFLAGAKSLSGACPDQVFLELRNVVAVLAGPADPRFPAAVAQAVGAFGDDGVPVQQAAPKRRWSSLVARVADTVDRYSRLAAALWGLFTLAAVIFFIFRGGIELSKIQLQK
jgi:hypothetical protein